MKKLLLLACLAWGMEVNAQGHAISGIGASLCAEYMVEEANSDLEFMFLSWAQGFASSHFVSNGISINEALLDIEFLRNRLNNYCEDAPDAGFYVAAMQLTIYLRERRIEVE